MLLDAAGIARVEEHVVHSEDEALQKAGKLGFPLVMKVVGPVHKSDVGGVFLNVDSFEKTAHLYGKLMKIKDADAVLLQPMIKGQELFAGAIREGDFGHMIMAGLGGIFIEILKDVNTALAPLSNNEAKNMIYTLKGYDILKGARSQQGVNNEAFADVLIHLSALLEAAPEITEMDLNPLMGNMEMVSAVDARIRIEK